MPIKTRIGDKSIPPNMTGTKLRIRDNTGSVTLCMKRTIGLKGSGLTQDRTARAKTTNMKKVRTRSMTFATAVNR